MKVNPLHYTSIHQPLFCASSFMPIIVLSPITQLIIRVTEKKSDRYLYERVGTEVSNYFQKVNLHDSVPNSAILIVPNLNIQQLEESAQKAFKSWI